MTKRIKVINKTIGEVKKSSPLSPLYPPPLVVGVVALRVGGAGPRFGALGTESKFSYEINLLGNQLS